MPGLDGELDPETGEGIGDHVERCPECREEWQAFQALCRVTRDLDFNDPSPVTPEAFERELDRRHDHHVLRTTSLFGGVMLFGATVLCLL